MALEGFITTLEITSDPIDDKEELRDIASNQ